MVISLFSVSEIRTLVTLAVSLKAKSERGSLLELLDLQELKPMIRIDRFFQVSEVATNAENAG